MTARSPRYTSYQGPRASAFTQTVSCAPGESTQWPGRAAAAEYCAVKRVNRRPQAAAEVSFVMSGSSSSCQSGSARLADDQLGGEQFRARVAIPFEQFRDQHA